MCERLKGLHLQMKRIITNLCNKVGCEKCPDKWDGGCIASDTQDKIFNIEIEEFKQGNKQNDN